MKLLRALQGPAFLLLVCSMFYWRLTLTDEYTWLNSPDLANQVLPWYEFQAAEFHAGRIPLWDPYHWGGQPLYGQVITGAAYPLNWILFSLPLENGWIRQSFLHWYFVLLHYLGALFCYLLCRDLKRSRGASLIAGCAFGLGGYMGITAWPVMLNGAMWAPLVLMFLLRVARGDRPNLSAPLGGAMLGIAFLSGHHQVPIFIGLMSGAIWLYLILRDRSAAVKMALLATSFAVMTASVSALQMLPAIEYGKLAVRWVGIDDPVGWDQKVPYQMQAQFANQPITILETVFPGLTQGTNTFIGIVAVSMAAAAFLLLRRKLVVRLLGAVALGGLLYCIAPFNTFQGMLYALVPMVEKARSPSMAIVLFHLACAVLFAFAIDSSQVRRSRPLHLILFWLPVIFYTAIMGFVYSGRVPIDERLLMTPLIALLACALLALWRRGEVGPHFAKAALLFLVLLELANVTFYSIGSKYLKTGPPNLLVNLAANADIFKYFRTVPGPFRVDLDGKEFPANMGDWHGIETYGGYLASLTANLRRLNGDAHVSMDLFAVNYAVRKESNRPGQHEVFKGASGLKVFINTTAMPRAWIVHRARQVEKVEAVPKPREEALFLRPAPQLETCEGHEGVQWESRRPAASSLSVETACRALVIIADTYFPGWNVTVDGKPVEILEVDSALRGIVVDKGAHRIAMRYRPTSVIAGGIVTGLGLLTTLALLALSILPAKPSAISPQAPSSASTP